jgi:hypothetical protein
VAALEAAGLGGDVPFATRLYGLDGSPNFKDPHHADADPAFVLRLAARPDAIAREMGISDAEFRTRRARVDAALLAVRSRRKQPATDDKTLAAWMAEGLADAGDALGSRVFVEAAGRAVNFVLEQMRAPDGGLLRCWREEHAEVDAFLEDYANMANACLAIGRATGDWRWRDEARALVAMAEARFLDPETGAWFDVPAGAGDLFARVRSTDDGAMPSGTSSILRATAAVAAGVRDVGLLDRADRALRAIEPALREQPVSASGSVLAARALLDARASLGG